MRKSLEIAKEYFKNKTADYNAVIGVEVGVYEGRNAESMLKNFPNLFILHLIDSYIGRFPFYYHDARKRLKEYDNRIVWHIASSQYAVNFFVNNTIDFVYIDDGHEYEFIRGDIVRWWPKVRIGGMLCGHDYVLPTHLDIVTAVDEFVKENNLTLHTCNESDWWIFKE